MLRSPLQAHLSEHARSYKMPQLVDTSLSGEMATVTKNCASSATILDLVRFSFGVFACQSVAISTASRNIETYFGQYREACFARAKPKIIGAPMV